MTCSMPFFSLFCFWAYCLHFCTKVCTIIICHPNSKSYTLFTIILFFLIVHYSVLFQMNFKKCMHVVETRIHVDMHVLLHASISQKLNVFLSGAYFAGMTPYALVSLFCPA